MTNSNYNVKLFAGRRNSDNSFPIYISFSGNDVTYLTTQRKNNMLYDIFKQPGITLPALDRLYHENHRSHRSCEVKNSIKHIKSVADDFIKYEYYAEGGENDEKDLISYRPSLGCGQG